MSGFSAHWLALREPFDQAARAPELEAALAAWACDRGRLAIVDLGAGTGANLRHLAARLPVAQRWRLVEHDPALIAAGEARVQPRAELEVRWLQRDLMADLEGVLEAPVDLLTCSALLDLVSRGWLERLVARVRELDCALLAVLSYDGRVELEPAHPSDARVIELVNRHQRTDKGFGAALGPEAAATLARLLEAAGDSVRLARADWSVGPEDRALQIALVEGWAAAARAIAPEQGAAIDSWRADRLAAIARGVARCQVGHLDLLRLARRQRPAP